MPQEIVELRGHLIDSLILPKVLDTIMALGAHFEIQQVEVGVRRVWPPVMAPSAHLPSSSFSFSSS